MKVLVAGDFCPQSRVAELFERGSYSDVLGEVKETIESADYSIVNFECPITKGGEKPIEKIGPNLHCGESGLQAVKWAGFDCVTLANNHFLDYGEEGVKNTLDACKKIGIDTVGGGINLQEASKILYKEINGQTLAIINCCEHEFSIATDDTAGSNPLNPIKQYYAIQEAHKMADCVLVIVHGGHEYYQLPSLRMQETYRFFIDAGADAVVNHHQHCYSGYEIYHDKPIFYGLGNFCFDKSSMCGRIWNEGYLVTLNFACINSKFKLYPYLQCDFVPRLKMLKLNSFEEKINELNEIIASSNLLREAEEIYYRSCDNQYSSIFEPINNLYYLGAKRRGWLPSLISKNRRLTAADFILCEAHRDKLLYWLMRHNEL